MSTATSPLQRLLRSDWLRPFNDPLQINDWLGLINPAWSLDATRLRVLERIQETPDAWTFVLAAGRRWPGFHAGQHVLLTVESGGRRLTRCYSLSSASSEHGRIAITVKRQAHGRMSSALHERLQVGDVVTVSEASGDFVLPAEAPRRLLFLAAGSGITPLMSHLRTLHAARYEGSIVLVFSNRDAASAIFGDELRKLAREWPALTLHEHHSGVNGRLDIDAIRRLVPDHDSRHTLLCGPHGFATAVRQAWAKDGRSGQLQVESFGFVAAAQDVQVPREAQGRAGAASTAAAETQHEIRCSTSERVFSAASGRTLLEQAEAAGLRPAHGCRAGLCYTCKCRKPSGVVENLKTGELSTEPGEWIQLCISAARSDVTLEI